MHFPWERMTGEPLIYASMGTLLNGRVDVFRAIVAAVAKHKNLQLVLSVGDQIDPKKIRPAPSNAITVSRAPQLELLKRTSVCITHAGLNTVLESLAQGVPQVAIPVAYDQPGVAARMAHKQTGVVTSLDKLSADHLSTLLNEVLTDSTYRDNARKLQKAIAVANGLSVAADLVEKSLGLTKEGPSKSQMLSAAMRTKGMRIVTVVPSPISLRTSPAETSARTILAAAGVTAPAREPGGVLRRKAVRLPSKAHLARHRVTLISSHGPVAQTTRWSRPARGEEWSPCWIAFSTSGWKEKGGIRTFNKPGSIVCSTFKSVTESQRLDV